MHAYKSHLVYYRTVVMHVIYRYDTFKVSSCGKTGCTESKQIHDKAICIIQKATHVASVCCAKWRDHCLQHSMCLHLSQEFVTIYYSCIVRSSQHSRVSLNALWHPLPLFPSSVLQRKNFPDSSTFGSGVSSLVWFPSISPIILWLI